MKIYPMPEDLDIFEQHEVKKLNKKGLATPKQLELISKYESVHFNVPSVHTSVNCTFIGKNDDYYLMDAGFKDYIRVPNRPSESKYIDKMDIGQKTEVYIDAFIDNPFHIEGSISSLKESQAHDILTNSDDYVTGYVREIIPAGYMVDININGVELNGFLPNTHADVNRLSDPESIVGKTLTFAVESYSDEKGTYILSRRNYLLTQIPAAIKKLKFDTKYTGTITDTTTFGVFVQFEEILTGMIHKTMIHPDWQDRLNEIEAGTLIDFFVKDIFNDGKNTKIVLTQILKPTLWDDLEIGECIDGTVKSVREFGVLVSLDDETYGLISQAELDRKNIAYEVGDDVTVKVIKIDRPNRKIQLRIK